MFSVSTPSAASVMPRARRSGKLAADQRPGKAAAAPRPADTDALGVAAQPAEALVLDRVDVAPDLTGDLVPVPADPPERRVGLDRVGQVAVVVLVRRLAEAPVVAERLDPGIPDLPQMLGLNLPDLDTRRERRVGEIVEVRADHRVAEPDRLVARLRDDRFPLGRRVAAEGFEHLVARRIRRGQISEMILHCRNHQRQHPFGRRGRIEEREDLVDARARDLLVDAAADVADDLALELDNGHVPRRVEVRRVLVVLLHLLVRGREWIASRGSGRVRDDVHRRVVVRGAQVAEHEPGDVRQRPLGPEGVGHPSGVAAGHQSSVK